MYKSGAPVCPKPLPLVGGFVASSEVWLPAPFAAETFESLISTSDAATLAGVTVAAISNWRERGYTRTNAETGQRERVYLTPAAMDGRGRPLYRWLDVAKAERATRDRARRKFAA